MLEKSLGLLFYLKKRKITPKDPYRFTFRIAVDGIPKEMSTKRFCDPEKWSARANRAVGNKEDVKAFSLYLALFWSWKQHGFCEPFPIYRKELMMVAHINSIATYHKCIKDLINKGVIKYMPSYNYYQGSLIYITETA